MSERNINNIGIHNEFSHKENEAQVPKSENSLRVDLVDDNEIFFDGSPMGVKQEIVAEIPVYSKDEEVMAKEQIPEKQKAIINPEEERKSISTEKKPNDEVKQTNVKVLKHSITSENSLKPMDLNVEIGKQERSSGEEIIKLEKLASVKIKSSELGRELNDQISECFKTMQENKPTDAYDSIMFFIGLGGEKAQAYMEAKANFSLRNNYLKNWENKEYLYLSKANKINEKHRNLNEMFKLENVENENIDTEEKNRLIKSMTKDLITICFDRKYIDERMLPVIKKNANLNSKIDSDDKLVGLLGRSNKVREYEGDDTKTSENFKNFINKKRELLIRENKLDRNSIERLLKEEKEFSLSTYYEKSWIEEQCKIILEGKICKSEEELLRFNPFKLLTLLEQTKRAEKDKLISKSIFNEAKNNMERQRRFVNLLIESKKLLIQGSDESAMPEIPIKEIEETIYNGMKKVEKAEQIFCVEINDTDTVLNGVEKNFISLATEKVATALEQWSDKLKEKEQKAITIISEKKEFYVTLWSTLNSKINKETNINMAKNEDDS
jgi:hypothetical protein